jgi:phytoene dehydrogenase-like protein
MPPSSPLQARYSFHLTVFSVSTASYTYIVLLVIKFFVLVDYALDDDGLFKCNCMPACTEITYDVEISQAKFSWLETINALGKAAGSNHTTTAK